MKIKGIITKITPVQTGQGAKGTWSKFCYVLTEKKDQYPDKWLVEAFNKEKEANVGDFVEVDVNCRVTEVGDKDYPSMNLYKLEVVQSRNVQPSQPQAPPTYTAEEVDDLPF